MDRASDTETDPENTDNAVRTGESESELSDPVKIRFEDSEEDLQNIATWEVRSGLDRFAVRLTRTLRTGRRALLISLGLALFSGQIIFAGLLVIEEPILGVLALASVVPALALAAYVWYGDPTSPEPLELLAVTFLLSMVFASFAAVANSLALPVFELLGTVGLPLFFLLIVGPVEETVKWLAIRIHAYRKDAFDTVVDGAVYGAAAGLGFAAIENLIYIILAFISTAGAGELIRQQYAIATAATRAFVGPGHVIFSAWAGFYLGLAKFNPENRAPIVVKGLLIATFIHALYNIFVTFVVPTMLGFIVFVVCYHTFWFGLLSRKISRYRTLHDRTSEEHAADTPSR